MKIINNPIQLTLYFLILGLVYVTDVSAQSTSISSNNSKTIISVDDGKEKSFSIEYEGEITISDDDRDVVSISRGGYLEIKKSAFGSRRRIYMESDNAGGVIKKYYVGSREKSYEAEGEKWLAEILPEIIRTTTIGADKRVERLYRQGGVTSVLNEIEDIESDHVSAFYINALLQKNLSDQEMSKTLGTVKRINSDHHKANILKDNLDLFLASSQSITAFFTASESISSDHHKADILIRAIKDDNINQEDVSKFFVLTDKIDSDHHKANILLTLLSERDLNSDNLNLIINSTKNIHSDHHTANVLLQTLESPNLAKNDYRTLLQAVKEINSDHHIANILTKLLKKDLNQESIEELIDLSSHAINSDHHQANILTHVLSQYNPKNERLRKYLTSVNEVNSDHHQASLFIRLAENKYDASDLVMILNSIGSIDSDHHQSNVLLSFSDQVSSGSEEVKKAYRMAAKNIHSETFYGKAIRAIE